MQACVAHLPYSASVSVSVSGDFVLGCGIIAGAGPDVWFCRFDLVMLGTDK